MPEATKDAELPPRALDPLCEDYHSGPEQHKMSPTPAHGSAGYTFAAPTAENANTTKHTASANLLSSRHRSRARAVSPKKQEKPPTQSSKTSVPQARFSSLIPSPRHTRAQTKRPQSDNQAWPFYKDYIDYPQELQRLSSMAFNHSEPPSYSGYPSRSTVAPPPATRETFSTGDTLFGSSDPAYSRYGSHNWPPQNFAHPLQPPPTAPGVDARGVLKHTKSIDPIELVDNYLEVLRSTKEKELIEAHRILRCIAQRTSCRSEIHQPPDALSFQIKDYEPINVGTHSASESSLSSEASRSSVTSSSIHSLAMPPETIGEPNSMCFDNSAGHHDNVLTRRSKSVAKYSQNVSTSHGNNASAPITERLPITYVTTQEPQATKNSQQDSTTTTPPPPTTTQGQSTLLKNNDMVSLFSSIYLWLKRWLRRPPRVGTQRLEWTCECGEEMFADVPIANSAQYQHMLDFLTQPATAERGSGNSESPSHDLELGGARSSLFTSQTSHDWAGNDAKRVSTIGSDNTYARPESPGDGVVSARDGFARNSYLELCVNVGKYETILAEIPVSSSTATCSTICTDGHLFHKIYDRYHRLRAHIWHRFMFRPTGIRFVHFGVQTGHRVSFFTGDPLPPEDLVASKMYEYTLQPPVPPPMDSRTFLHYFWKHHVHSQTTNARYVHRLPKKVGESLTRHLGSDELRDGWGIHILEGPNKAAICWAALGVLVISFVVSVAYDVITKGEEAGFAIGQWLVGVGALVLSALYYSLDDQVDVRYD